MVHKFTRASIFFNLCRLLNKAIKSCDNLNSTRRYCSSFYVIVLVIYIFNCKYLRFLFRTFISWEDAVGVITVYVSTCSTRELLILSSKFSFSAPFYNPVFNITFASGTILAHLPLSLFLFFPPNSLRLSTSGQARSGRTVFFLFIFRPPVVHFFIFLFARWR